MPNHLSSDPDGPQRRNRPAELAAPSTGKATVVPRYPSGIGKRLAGQWDAVWRSPLAAVLDPDTDIMAMRRLWRLYQLSADLDRRIDECDPDKLDALYRIELPDVSIIEKIADLQARFDRLDSTLALRAKYATECRMLETQLGLTPRARLGMGVMLKAAGGDPSAPVDEADWSGDEDA